MTQSHFPDRFSIVTDIEQLLSEIADVVVEPRANETPARLFVRCNTLSAVSEVTETLTTTMKSSDTPFTVELDIDQPAVDPSGFVVIIDICL